MVLVAFQSHYSSTQATVIAGREIRAFTPRRGLWPDSVCRVGGQGTQIQQKNKTPPTIMNESWKIVYLGKGNSLAETRLIL